ncbi:MAG: GreA/GreB family elongation factor [Proteobacteria bacterium]|nr:GreA/GreB family elongation factor [Pseudomonadota bacterium]
MELTEIDKGALLEAIVKELAGACERMTARAKAAAESAVHEEARSEDSHDTRAIEESYLARGQAARAAEMEVDLATMKSLRARSFADSEPIAATALVELEDDGGASRTLLIVPRCGGRNLHFGGREITLATPASPLGAALMGASEGDEVEISIKGRKRTYEILGTA